MFNQQSNNLTLTVLVILVGLDLFLWSNILFFDFNSNPQVYFLDVGQGDSSLIVLAGGVLILVDAGPDGRVIQSLDRIFTKKRHYIDLAVITHPQRDHFAGFLELLRRYQFGAFVINGREADDQSKIIYDNFIKELERQKIPVLTLGAGDKILYKNNLANILSPDKNWINSAELNDTSLVLDIKTPDFSIFLSGDIGSSLEKYLLSKFNLKSDILKIAHHGSKYSSDVDFLKKVLPSLALIGVGKNSYGHPAKQTLLRFKNLNIPVFRTDLNGTIYIFKKDNKLIVETKK